MLIEPGGRKSFPHARGGGPKCPLVVGVQAKVFPTHVGVDQQRILKDTSIRRFPHARGGGPTHPPGQRQPGRVFPTRVGVDRNTRHTGRYVTSFPHARGGGPCLCLRHQGHLLFSPRTWGWTAGAKQIISEDRVFPTHAACALVRVGVDLSRRWTLSTCMRFPHARGGGPTGLSGKPALWLFSPRMPLAPSCRWM